MIKLFRCPRAVFGNRDVARVTPFFQCFVNSNGMAYPDGRGLYYQPKKLVKAFGLLSEIYMKEKES